MGADHGDDGSAGSGRTAELAGLAREFVDLWQDQVAASLADPETAETLTRLTAMWSGAASAMMAALAGAGESRSGQQTGQKTGAGTGGGSGTHDRQADAGTDADFAGETASSKAGSAAALAASGAGGDALARLAGRLDAVEARLAALEGRAGKRSGGRRPKAG